MLIAALAFHILTSRSLLQRTDDGSIFPGDGSYAVNSEHTHDPCIVELDGRTFCFSTGNGGSMKSTKDFKTWTIHGPIMTTPPPWLRTMIPEHRSIWAPDGVKVGNKVRHAKFGLGVVLSVTGEAENSMVDVVFATHGPKKLALAYAKLEKVK